MEIENRSFQKRGVGGQDVVGRSWSTDAKVGLWGKNWCPTAQQGDYHYQQRFMYPTIAGREDLGRFDALVAVR